MENSSSSICNFCGKPCKDIYRIPLAEDWSAFTGQYCSRSHALLGNKYTMGPNRCIDQWKKRHEWMMKEYKSTNDNFFDITKVEKK